MAIDQRSYIGLPQVAIAADAVTPDPGVAGVWVYSTTETAPLCWNGTAWKLVPAGQTVNDLTELTPADPAADFLLVWDTSAAVTKKVKPNNLGIAGGGGSGITTVTLTVSPAKFGHATVTVAHVGMTTGSKIVGAALQATDEWGADDFDDIEVTTQPDVDQLLVTLSTNGPLVGDFSLSYITG